MKYLYLSVLLLGAFLAKAQRTAINSRNYYTHYAGPTAGPGGMAGPIAQIKSRKLGLNWLRWDEVTPLLVDEMKKAGYEDVYSNQLYRLDSAQYVVLAAYSLSSDVGFLYVEGHAAFPAVADHQPGKLLAGDGHDAYVQVAHQPAGNIEVIRVHALPANLSVLAENWYWYQFTYNPRDNKRLVTKEDIMRVLREDIREKLLALPKPIRRQSGRGRVKRNRVTRFPRPVQTLG